MIRRLRQVTGMLVLMTVMAVIVGTSAMLGASIAVLIAGP